MRLTTDQYRRGVVKWRTNDEATVVITAREGGDSVIASSPMSDPSGSVPDVVPATGGSVVLRPASSEVLSGSVRITWDRLVGDEIETLVWDNNVGDLWLVGIPAAGRFEHLVLSTPYLRWAEELVVRAGDVVVRFTDRVVLERQEPALIEHGQSQSSFTIGVSTERLAGSFVEITAPVTIAKEHDVVFAVLALLALILGDAAVGDVVQLDTLSSTPAGTEYAVRFPHHTTPSAVNSTLRMRRPVTLEDTDTFDRLLVRLLDDDALVEDAVLPLRWYERALRTENDVDRFLAAFLGLEALVTRRSKRLGFVSPIAKLLNDPRVPEMLEPLHASYPSDQVNRLLSRLQDKNPSLLDRFDRVADDLALGEQTKEAFRAMRKGRHPLVHGGRGGVDEGLPDASVKLLATVLRAALDGDERTV